MLGLLLAHKTPMCKVGKSAPSSWLYFNREYCYNKYTNPWHLCHHVGCAFLCSAKFAQPYTVALYSNYLRQFGGTTNKLEQHININVCPPNNDQLLIIFCHQTFLITLSI